MTCFHCGNQTSMKIVAKHNVILSNDIVTPPFEETFTTYLDKTWYLYFCPVCKEVTLQLNTRFSEDIDVNGEPYLYEDIIYPSFAINAEYIPKGVKDAFESALKVRNLDGAVCVLALRRALEKMCKDKGANGKDLFNKLKDLQSKKILPEIMNDISYILRKEGNSAAHADDIEFDQETVNLMIEFTQTIFDYVYTLPEKIKKAQERIKKLDKVPKNI